MVKKTLKSVHNFFLLFGVNISFVKKENYTSAIDWNSQNSMNNLFSDKEKQNDFMVQERLQFFDNIIGIVQSNNIDLTNKTVADFGCGMGDLLSKVTGKFDNVKAFGFDFSGVAVEVAKSRFPGLSFGQHDLYDEINQNYDLVLCTEVLEHLLYPEKALRNIAKCLSQNGYAFITVPDGRKDTFYGHINFWSIESWRVFIESNCTEHEIQVNYMNDNNILYALIRRQ